MISSGPISQIRRYENKYVVPESLCPAIRAFIAPYCRPDPYINSSGRGYMVNSLYLDSHQLDLYWANVAQHDYRKKLRVRTYGVKPTEFAWLEVKHRIGNTVHKNRVRVRTEQWLSAAAGKRSFNNAGKGGPSDETTANHFFMWVDYHQVFPWIKIAYYREPWISDFDYYARVTFDRVLTCAPAMGDPDLSYQARRMILFDDALGCHFSESPVILELKCETRVPYWIFDLIKYFDLMKRGFSKYCLGTEQIMGLFDPGMGRISTASGL